MKRAALVATLVTLSHAWTRGLAGSRLAVQRTLRMRADASPEAHYEGPIPVTLISGFLGAGKTTLLRHLLQNTDGVRIGVIVNDVAAVNVDAKLVQKSGLVDEGMPEDMIELSNGCACCSAGDDLFGALAELVSSGFARGIKYDHLIFEVRPSCPIPSYLLYDAVRAQPQR